MVGDIIVLKDGFLWNKTQNEYVKAPAQINSNWINNEPNKKIYYTTAKFPIWQKLGTDLNVSGWADLSLNKDRIVGVINAKGQISPRATKSEHEAFASKLSDLAYVMPAAGAVDIFKNNPDIYAVKPFFAETIITVPPNQTTQIDITQPEPTINIPRTPSEIGDNIIFKIDDRLPVTAVQKTFLYNDSKKIWLTSTQPNSLRNRIPDDGRIPRESLTLKSLDQIPPTDSRWKVSGDGVLEFVNPMNVRGFLFYKADSGVVVQILYNPQVKMPKEYYDAMTKFQKEFTDWKSTYNERLKRMDKAKADAEEFARQAQKEAERARNFQRDTSDTYARGKQLYEQGKTDLANSFKERLDELRKTGSGSLSEIMSWWKTEREKLENDRNKALSEHRKAISEIQKDEVDIDKMFKDWKSLETIDTTILPTPKIKKNYGQILFGLGIIAGGIFLASR